MGFTTWNAPETDPSELATLPLQERLRILTRHWVEYGFGAPRMIATIYLVKIVVLWALGGAVIITATSGLGWFWEVGSWWNQPIVYQKFMVWTMLLETIGLAGSWGPMTAKFKPFMGASLFWLRPGTIRLPPWGWVPFTKGDRRTVGDVILYAAFLAALVATFVLPGTVTSSLAQALPGNTVGLVQLWPVAASAVLLIVLGLRDKGIFLGARGEQYLPALVFFSVLPFVDMIIALKLLIVVVWVGAALSKLGRHFSRVIPAMLSNTPFWPPRWLKRSLYAKHPTDLRPSRLSHFAAHGLGFLVEFAAPLVLLFSQNQLVTTVAVVAMVGYCFFIVSTFPFANPLEWNLLFAYGAVFLFIGFPAWDGYAVSDFSSIWALLVVVAGLVFFPILGNFRPDLVSFLPSMRQYAGNWAASIWTFRPDAERKLERVPRPMKNTVDQLQQIGYDPAFSEMVVQQIVAWRSMHTQGRGLLSVLIDSLPDIDERLVREGEITCGSLIGFNFGDGHLHNEAMIRAVQARAQFEPGECVVAWVESQPVGSSRQQYKLIDAALGVVERGSWRVKDVAEEQPWLPNGPVRRVVQWQDTDALRRIAKTPAPVSTPDPAGVLD